MGFQSQVIIEFPVIVSNIIDFNWICFLGSYDLGAIPGQPSLLDYLNSDLRGHSGP